MQTREERDNYYAEKRKREAIEGSERAIKRLEALIPPLEAARAMAKDAGDGEFSVSIELDIQDYKQQIVKHLRDIIITTTGAQMIARDRAF